VPARVSEVANLLIDAGLTITMFREHEVLPWRRDAAQVAARPGEAHLEATYRAASAE
jgi:hypothetical protein